jgi:hypothetical protein
MHRKFVGTVTTGGAVKHLIVHCRECILNGLNPKDNRRCGLNPKP